MPNKPLAAPRNRVALLSVALCLALTLSNSSTGLLRAQASPVTPSKSEKLKIQVELLNAQSETLFNKLRDLTEFQQYLTVQRELQQANSDYQAALKAEADKAKPGIKVDKK